MLTNQGNMTTQNLQLNSYIINYDCLIERYVDKRLIEHIKKEFIHTRLPPGTFISLGSVSLEKEVIIFECQDYGRIIHRPNHIILRSTKSLSNKILIVLILENC